MENIMKKQLKILWIIPYLSISFSTTHNISIIGGTPGYDPSELTVEPGDVIVWTNNHTFNHTVTSTDLPEAWEDANISPGNSFELTFDNSGVFPYDCAYHSSMTGTITVSSLESEYPFLLVETFQLYSNYPNPFNPATNIQYSLLNNTQVELLIYNLQGQRIQTLIDDFQTVGYYSINWDATSYPSGLYLMNLRAGEYMETQKLLLIK